MPVPETSLFGVFFCTARWLRIFFATIITRDSGVLRFSGLCSVFINHSINMNPYVRTLLSRARHGYKNASLADTAALGRQGCIR